jgi:hypothetical protein
LIAAADDDDRPRVSFAPCFANKLVDSVEIRDFDSVLTRLLRSNLVQNGGQQITIGRRFCCSDA